MRIPFPTQIPIKYLTLFAIALAAMQLVEGTSVYFSAFLFIMMAGAAFNVAGGFSHVSGSYIFFFSTLTAIVGWLTKIVVGEAADTNLLVPNQTVSVYVGTMFSMLIAIILSKRLTPKDPLLKNFLTDDNAKASATGCAAVGFGILLAGYVLPHGSGDFINAVQQVNPWPLLGVVIAVQYEIRRSGGTRSLNTIGFLSGACFFVFNGLLGFSKAGLFEPILGYLAAAASMGYKFSLKQVAIGAIGLYFMVTYMVPYSQYGRQFKSAESASLATFYSIVETSVTQLSDLQGVREHYLEAAQDISKADSINSYFDTSHGLFDRLEMFSPDDKLIDATDQGRSEYGLYPLWFAVINTIPHFIWKDKPSYMFGNLYMHEIIFYQGDDYTTGISFSPAGQAYHMAGWYGVFLAAPLVFFAFFLFFDSFCGDLRLSPWGLVMAAECGHMAPEGMLDSPLASIPHLGLSVVLAAYFCAYIMPIIGSLIAGPQKKNLAVGPG